MSRWGSRLRVCTCVHVRACACAWMRLASLLLPPASSAACSAAHLKPHPPRLPPAALLAPLRCRARSMQHEAGPAPSYWRPNVGEQEEGASCLDTARAEVRGASVCACVCVCVCMRACILLVCVCMRAVPN